MTATPPLLLGLGLATPAHNASQSQTLALGAAVTLDDPSQSGLVEGLYTRAGVQRRASVLFNSVAAEGQPPDQQFFPAADQGCWPTTAARMRAFDRSACELALRAAREAMNEAGILPEQITDLVTVSCTGLSAPGVDIALMDGLSLSAGVRRLNIGFMGCHGAIVALRTCAALVAARATNRDRPPRVLAVCIELCSLHLQRTARVDRHVSNALFADGCAAMIIGDASSRSGSAPAATTPPADPPRNPAAPVPDASNPRILPLSIVDASSMLFPGSTSAMGWQIGDHGFEMTLDRSVPSLLERHLGAWVWPWLRSHLGSSAGPNDVRWAIHPGGPRVLDAIERALALAPDHTHDSRAVLRDHGNMSSPTVLFIVDRLRSRPDDRRPIVALAFGPGLTGEAALIEPSGDPTPR